MSHLSKAIGILAITIYLPLFALSFLNDRVEIYALLAIIGVLFVLSNNAWIRYSSIPAVICAVIFLVHANNRDIRLTAAAVRAKENARLRDVLAKKGIILEKIENALPDGQQKGDADH